MSDQAWGVWCAVWGGVTGHRELWLKTGSGDQAKTWSGTREQAEQRAAELTTKSRMKCSFSYTARSL